MNLVVRLALIHLLLYMLSSCVHTSVSSVPIEKDLKAAAEMLNEATPVAIDRLTTLVSVRAIEKRLISQFKIQPYTKIQINLDKFAPIARNALMNKVCAERNSRELLSRGASFEQVYKDVNDEEIVRISVGEADCLNTGVDVDPLAQHAFSECERAGILTEQEKFEEAIKSVNACLEKPFLPPEMRSMGLSLRGTLWSSLKEYDKAIKDQLKSLELTPGTHEEYMLLGSYYRHSGNLRESERVLNVAVGLVDKHSDNGWEVFVELGLTSHALERYADAVEYFSKVIDQQRGFRNTYIERARSYEKLEKDDLLQEDLQHFVELSEGKKISEKDLGFLKRHGVEL